MPFVSSDSNLAHTQQCPTNFLRSPGESACSVQAWYELARAAPARPKPEHQPSDAGWCLLPMGKPGCAFSFLPFPIFWMSGGLQLHRTFCYRDSLLICHLPSFQGYPDITCCSICGLKFFCCWLLASRSLTVAVPCWSRSNDFRCPCCSSVFLSYSDLNSYIWICCSSVAVRMVRRHKARLFHFRIWQ